MSGAPFLTHLCQLFLSLSFTVKGLGSCLSPQLFCLYTLSLDHLLKRLQRHADSSRPVPPATASHEPKMDRQTGQLGDSPPG